MAKHAGFGTEDKCASVHAHIYVHLCIHVLSLYSLRSCDVECIREKNGRRKLICSLLACGDWPVACDWEVFRWETVV